jgi:hypothetical protein
MTEAARFAVSNSNAPGVGSSIFIIHQGGRHGKAMELDPDVLGFDPRAPGRMGMW